jgi:hypothetical protein
MGAIPGDGLTCMACNVPFHMITFDANLKPSIVDRDIQHVSDFDSLCTPTLCSEDNGYDCELKDESRQSDVRSDSVTTA